LTEADCEWIVEESLEAGTALPTLTHPDGGKGLAVAESVHGHLSPRYSKPIKPCP